LDFEYWNLEFTPQEDNMGYFKILAAIPGFFLSALILMLLWRTIAPQIGLINLNYPQSMLVTITLWLAVAPLAAVGKYHWH
jgi:hypothetical protein